MGENKGGLISRAALQADLQKRYCKSCPRIENCNLIACEVGFALDEIEDAPTVDAVEVVRCKNCRYSRGMNDAEKKLYLDEVLICTSGDMGTGVECPVFQNDYCSYGERKDGADNA